MATASEHPPEARGYRCEIGCASWPPEAQYRTCPICNEKCDLINNAYPPPADEAHSIAAQARFEHWLDDHGRR